MIVSGGGQRAHPRLTVRRDRIAPGETVDVGDVRTTSPLRTAYDLGRQRDLVEAVVAVDAPANRATVHPDLLLNFAARAVAAADDPGAGRPAATVSRHPVQDPGSRTAVWLDLARPDLRIGIADDGAEHTTPQRVRRDIARHTRLPDQGWRVYRYTRNEIVTQQERIVAEISRARVR